jgi:Cof subfamily protein (haloacid dehalogenase superfamily)
MSAVVLLAASVGGLRTVALPSAEALVRLICCDIDGTLLTPDHRVTDRTRRVVLRAMSEVTFCPCTGRGRVGAYQALGELGRRLHEVQPPGVFLNGLIVYGPGGQLLSDMALQNDVSAEVAAFAAEHSDISLIGFSGDRSLCASRSKWTQFLASAHDPDPEVLGPWRSILSEHRVNKLMLMGQPERMARLRPLLAERLGESASLVCSGPPEMLEVLPAGASKGAGVQVLLDALGVCASRVLAIGDAENDIGMLRLAGTSVAMGNAKEEVCRAAGYISAANDADGAALAIDQHVLQPLGIARGSAYSAYCG